MGTCPSCVAVDSNESDEPDDIRFPLVNPTQTPPNEDPSPFSEADVSLAESETKPLPSPPPSGTLRYKMEKLIGEGTMGKCFKCVRL